MRVFPVEDDLFHVAERVEHEMITPFSPADGHGAISVHTGNENNSIQKKKKKNTLSVDAFPTNSFRNTDITSNNKGRSP